MKTDQQAPPSAKRYQPFVPESVTMTEFTWRALFIGLPLTLILGAANAYLGLRAGVTIAATYPAAVISMAVLRMFRGSILEENIARTAGSIGESVAAGAIFTLPAFVIAGVWPSFKPGDAYWKSTALMLVGSVLGVLFVSLVRRVMVEDRTLPFPESVAAGEIHKAGQRGSQAAKYLFYNMGFGAVVYLLGALRLFAVQARGEQHQARSRRERACDSNGRRDEIRGAERESGLYRRRLHHRAGAGGAEFFGRCPGMGTHGPAADLPARTAAPVVSPGRRRRGGGLDRHGGPSLALHRAADRGRRDARWSRVHALSDAQESFRRAEARIRGIPLGDGAAKIGRAD